MPTLNWIGKEAVINHHNDVPFRTLDKKYTFGSDASDNKIIHGDNLEALKALLPEYEGRIKCIYIDPPYNTGNENWIYNDNVNSPKIRKWLGQVVGKEAEDLTRHDKWLCMMYPRLKLLQKLLSDDGAIFISIDDNEQANLKLICDEIFGAGNFVNNVIWEKKYSPQNDAKYFSDNHDFILVYANNKDLWRPGLLPRTDEMNSRYKNLDNDPRGPWKASDCSVKTYSSTYDFPIKTPSGRVVNPPQGRCWRFSKEIYERLLSDNRIWFGPSGNNVPSIKRFLSEVKQGTTSMTIWKYDEVGHNQDAKQQMKDIFFDEKFPFDTPKPFMLIEKILHLATIKDCIILDSFAGSGTTAHAVLNLNKQDGGNRKFILVEMEDYAENITAERVRRVINGYGDGKNAVEGTGGSFSFYELGEPVFNADGYLNENIGTEKLREYIWYSETRKPYAGSGATHCAATKDTTHKYFLGNNNGTAYYFYYEKERITTLDKAFLNTITSKAEQYVVYADNCLLTPEFMNLNHIVFKKIPRDIKKI
jgi:adenine-specific DNA-methyltransferase